MEAHPFIASEYWKDHYEEVRRQIQEAEVYVCEMNGVAALADRWDRETDARVRAKTKARFKDLPSEKEEDRRSTHKNKHPKSYPV